MSKQTSTKRRMIGQQAVGELPTLVRSIRDAPSVFCFTHFPPSLLVP